MFFWQSQRIPGFFIEPPPAAHLPVNRMVQGTLSSYSRKWDRGNPWPQIVSGRSIRPRASKGPTSTGRSHWRKFWWRMRKKGWELGAGSFCCYADEGWLPFFQFPITAIREIKILQCFKNKNVVELLDICSTKGKSMRRTVYGYKVFFCGSVWHIWKTVRGRHQQIISLFCSGQI